MNPVTIAGGGLAGLSLGIALCRRGVDVTLHEAGRYPRHRVCGEFISGVSRATLDSLGVAEHLRDAVALGQAGWFDARGPLATVRVKAVGISRRLLDFRLQEAFQRAGGRLVCGSRAGIEGRAVWAAGRARVAGPWVGLKCHARGLPLNEDLEMHVGRGGYAGLARIEGGLVNVCGLFRKDLADGGPKAIEDTLRACGLPALAERLEAAGVDPESRCGVAGFAFGAQPGPAFAVGDAARMIPPFTGNGMSMALESASCALGPLLDFAAGRISWDAAAAASEAAQRKRFRVRMAAALPLQAVLSRFPKIVCPLARARLIPLGLLVRLTR